MIQSDTKTTLIIETLDEFTNSVLSARKVPYSEISTQALEILSTDGAVYLDNNFSPLSIDYSAADRQYRLRRKAVLDGVPYLRHDGRELILMMKGLKPFSAFIIDGIDEESACFDQPFLQLTGNRFYRSELYISQSATLLSYSIPGQEWRAQAYKLLLDEKEQHGSSAAVERLQGILLGYSTEERSQYEGYLSEMRKAASGIKS